MSESHHSEEANLLAQTSRLVAEALGAGGCADVQFLEAMASRMDGLSIDPPVQLQLMLDTARFMYVSGNVGRGLNVAQRAKRFAVAIADARGAAAGLTMVGICAADMGNLPMAMEAYSEAVLLAQSSGDRVREGKVWHNLGTALGYSGLFREAIVSFNRAMEFAQSCPELRGAIPDLQTNIACSYLNLEEIAQGHAAIKRAIELAAEPNSAHAIQNRVLAENYYTRILVEMGDYDGALARAKLARQFASKSKSPRADIQASVAEGLSETFSGNPDVGISRLTSTLKRAKTLRLASREVLVALVKALEFAGRHDEALACLKELLSQQRSAAEANVLRHIQQHLAKLHSADADAPIEDVSQAMRRMETRIEVVEGRAAKAELIRQRQEIFKARVEAMERLAVAAELRDDSTGEHSYRVGRLASLLAKEAGCDDETVYMVDIAARLHDIGKIGIPDGILLKPRAFNPAEREVMEMHAEIGADVLVKSQIPHIKMAEDIARFHHERWDGKGYPNKIGGEEIPLAARITALADVFDALTHKRPYKEAWTMDATLTEILAARGEHFDPELTDLFLRMMSRLRREQRDLDYFLGEAARANAFIQARGKIWDSLRLAKEEYQAQFARSFELQR